MDSAVSEAMVAIYGGAGVPGVDTEATPLPSARVSCVRLEGAGPERSSLSTLPSFCALTSVCSVRTGREIRHITSRHPGDKRTRRDKKLFFLIFSLPCPCKADELLYAVLQAINTCVHATMSGKMPRDTHQLAGYGFFSRPFAGWYHIIPPSQTIVPQQRGIAALARASP